MTIRPANWEADQAAIAALRREVFVAEQGVPEALEWEDVDPLCDWLLAWHGKVLAGIVRLSPAGKIGRMAVRREWRGRGAGGALLTAALELAKDKGFSAVTLHAQSHALDFYRRFGFQVTGPGFDEAGIPHRRMDLDLNGE